MSGRFLKFSVVLVVAIVRSVVIVYTWVTLPVYYLVQKPWKRVQISKKCGANLVDKGVLSNDAPADLAGAEYIEFERYAPIPEHPLMKCQTVPEAFEVIPHLYPKDKPSHGYREILEEEIQLDKSEKPIRIDGKSLRKYKLSDYKWLTLGQVLDRIHMTCRGMMQIGVKSQDRVALYAETGLDFFTSAFGSNFAGGVVVTLFHTLHDDGLIQALNETEAKYMITSFELLDRVAGFIDKCPKLKTIIYFEGPKKQTAHNLGADVTMYTYSDIVDRGKQCNTHNKIPAIHPEDLFMIMYTSGTTGKPKGVLATHRQIKEAAMAIGQVVRDIIPTGPQHTYIAYLPQAHILELSIELFLFIGGVRIGFATPFTLNESAPGLAKGQICDLQLLRPTVMSAVPLVLDRMQKEIYTKLSNRTPFSKEIFNMLIEFKANWSQKGYKSPITSLLLCRKVQEQFGGKLKYMVVGGAPLAYKLQALIKCALDITLIQGYGSTETSGGIICMDFDDLSYGRVGAPLNGVRVRLVDWPEGQYSIKDRPNPRGELLIGGLMISSGYFNMESQTKENFFDDKTGHWFITGDIGELYPDGTFKIIDRKKDLVKLSNGEFISLGKIESILKSSPFVENICINANGILNTLVGLVVPNVRAITELAKNQFHYPVDCTMKDICQDRAIVNFLHQDIVRTGFNQKLKPIELPSLITLCHEEWSPDNNLLTAAMKLKRANIATKHGKEIEAMFDYLRANPAKIRISPKSLNI